MITSNYYIVAAVSIMSLVLLLLHYKELDLISKKSIYQLRFLCCFIIAEIVIDTLFKSLEGLSEVEPYVLYTIKAIEFSLNPFIPFLILHLFNNYNFNQDRPNDIIIWIQRFQKAIIVINIGFQVASFFGKFMFYIDETNHYVRTNLTYLYVAFLVLSIASMFLAINVFSKRVQNSNYLTLCGTSIILASGFLIRIIVPSTNFDWLCVTIGMFAVDIYYVNLSLRLDPLTRLLNRQVYQTIVEKINFTTLIITIDANNFKSINDTYGHECGDKTLVSIAKCIFRAYGDYGWCFRIGGDEFCVILYPNIFKKLVDESPKNDVYLMSEKIMERLDEQIQIRASRDDNNCLHYGVSQGYGIYYSPSDYPTVKSNLPLDKVIKLADMRMYRKKNLWKKNFAENPDPNQEEARKNNKKRTKVAYESSNPELIESSDQE
jgi:diguanylate cyclase (GGDEF)-like protein